MGTLTNFPRDPALDLDAWVGQRRATFKFYVTDAVTRRRLGELHPIRNTEPARLEHNTEQTIKRQLSVALGTADTAQINPVADRIEPWMVFPDGREWPLGRYMFSNPSVSKYTSGKLGTYVLNDEMFLVDQKIRRGIGSINGSIPALIAQVMHNLPVQYQIEPCPFLTSEAWTIGTNRGQILEALSISGSYFSPWFDNNGILRFIRAFNASRKICDFDFDSGYKVRRDSIVETNDLLSAPNTFLVTANASENSTAPVVGVAYIASTAPNSVENRGFEIVSHLSMQVANVAQANAIAEGLAQRQSTLENVALVTPPDPRHDGYNVVRWDGANWLEIAWGMELIEGGIMTHTLRKTYGV